MATIVLDITDDKLVMQIKKVCSMIKGACRVKVVQNKDVTKTRGYQEAMDDIKAGRIYHAQMICLSKSCDRYMYSVDYTNRFKCAKSF